MDILTLGLLGGAGLLTVIGEIGAMLEGLANTDKGQELIGKVLGSSGGKKASSTSAALNTSSKS